MDDDEEEDENHNGNDDHAILIHNEKIATHWLFSSLQTLSIIWNNQWLNRFLKGPLPRLP